MGAKAGAAGFGVEGDGGGSQTAVAVVNVGEDGVEAGGRDAPVGEGVLRVVDVCEGDALRAG